MYILRHDIYLIFFLREKKKNFFFLIFNNIILFFNFENKDDKNLFYSN